MTDIIEQTNVPSPAKITWMRLYRRHKTRPFVGTYTSVADDLNMDPQTVKKHMSQLRKLGWVTYDKKYGRGLMHTEYCLVNLAKDK